MALMVMPHPHGIIESPVLRLPNKTASAQLTMLIESMENFDACLTPSALIAEKLITTDMCMAKGQKSCHRIRAVQNKFPGEVRLLPKDFIAPI